MDLQDVVLVPVRDLGAFIRDQREAAQISVRQLAKRAGVSNPYLSQIERGLRKPSAEMLAQIAHGLQISVETLLAKAGILDATAPPDAAPSVIAAIRADQGLTDRQKTSMLEIYQSFRGEALPDGPAAPASATKSDIPRGSETPPADSDESSTDKSSTDESPTDESPTERKDDVVHH
jgi:transcriptional regulator with XRE-family HTH domain